MQKLDYITPQVSRKQRRAPRHPLLVWWRRNVVLMGFVWAILLYVYWFVLHLNFDMDDDYHQARLWLKLLHVLIAGWAVYIVASLILCSRFDRPVKS